MEIKCWDRTGLTQRQNLAKLVDLVVCELLHNVGYVYLSSRCMGLGHRMVMDWSLEDIC